MQRRHSSLLGKLHEMKVAALEERRDRIMKNRRFVKDRKKTTTPPPQTTAPPTPSTSAEIVSPVGVGTGTHELKIKTVFQRHKQEQQGAATRSVSVGVGQQEFSILQVQLESAISICLHGERAQ